MEENNNNTLEKSSLSNLENSQFLYSDINNQISNIDQQNYQNLLQGYKGQNYQKNKKYHFEYSELPKDIKENNSSRLKNKSFNDDMSEFTFGQRSNQNSIALDSSLSNIPLAKTQIINMKNPEVLLEKKVNINQKGISLVNSTLLSAYSKDLSNSINIKKENLLITSTPYVGFENKYGDNSCYVNVVIHLLNNIPDVSNILKDIYQIEEMKNEEKNEKQKNNIYNKTLNEESLTASPYKNELLSSFGEKLIIYDMYMKKENTVKQVTILDTTDLRQILDKCSNGIFTFNYVADPVELLLYILDLLNIDYKEQIHNNFYLDLVDKTQCSIRCKSSLKVRFDKDNFSYHIYIEELLNYIKDEGIKFQYSKGNLFDLSLSLYKSEIKVCEKCSLLYEKFLLCLTTPKYLLINCVWKNQLPEQKEIIDFLFLLSLGEDLNRLFMCQSKNSKYNLIGMILYSYTLCHYTVLLYNKKAKVFSFYNDDSVKEFKTLYEFFPEMLINNINLYDNDKAYFYPTMLLYTNENVYDKNEIQKNELTQYKYLELLNKVEENQQNFIKAHTLTEEQKKKNLEELIKKQNEYENNLINQKKSQTEKPKSTNLNKSKISQNIDNNIEPNDLKTKISNSVNLNNTKNISNDNISGSDLLKLSNTQKIIAGKNYMNQLDLNNNINNKTENNIQKYNEYLKSIRDQSNENPNLNLYNNAISEQRLNMKNDFNSIEDNRLARTQIIPNNKNLYDKSKNISYNNNFNTRINDNKRTTDKINNNINQINNHINNINNKLNQSQQIFINNKYSQSFNEQNKIKKYETTLGKSQQNIGNFNDIKII